MDQLTPLRQQIAGLQIERRRIAEAGLHHEELQRRLEDFADQLARRGREGLAQAVEAAAAGAPFDPFRIYGAGSITGRSATVQMDTGPILAALLGPATIKKALASVCSEIAAGLPPLERAARLSELDAQLDRLEQDEEARVCALEAQGLEVDRRADARPEIVLGLNEEVMR